MKTDSIKETLVPDDQENTSNPRFVNFNEEEENSCIDQLTLLQFSCFKTYVVVPIFSVCTAMIFALCLFWNPSLRASWFYWKTNDMRSATHLCVCGRTKNVEIVELLQESGSKGKDTFTYRFIKYQFDK